ncbi:MAG: leucine-rich repeat protein [Oscillospiraceae bacterium]|nr:leucine-rich repeat protein [Oscillospiraceae bacterium]
MRMKKMLSAVLSVLLVLSMLPVEVFAQLQTDEAVQPQVVNEPKYTAAISHVNPEYARLGVKFTKPVADCMTTATSTVSNLAEASDYLRGQMEMRASNVTIVIKNYTFTNGDKLNSDWHSILDGAFAHTGVSTQGDYIRRHYGRCDGSLQFDGRSTATFGFQITYDTTLEQENAVGKRIGELFAQWETAYGFSSLSDYERLKIIYDYICENIVYDYDNLPNSTYMLKYSAYAALINGTAVCQGYANLLYRMALEAGVDTRIISGYGNGGAHAWNIVKMDGKYYYLDATWDAPYFDFGYRWFLLGSNSFLLDHALDEEFKTTAFLAQYPIDTADYPIPAPKNGTCGENLVWVLENDGTLTISGEGAMENYNAASDAPWSEFGSAITKVVIESGATSIGNYAFAGCSALAGITIPGSVTSIGRQAFAGCGSLTRVQVSANVMNIGQCAFGGCSKLAEIVVDSGNQYYSSLNGVLFNKDQTTLIACPAGRTQTEYAIPDGVTVIGKNAFEGCGSLANVTIPGSVTHIGSSAFSGCTRLATVYYYGTEWDQVVIEGNNDPLLKAKVVLCGTCGEDLTWMLTEDGQLSISGTGEMYAFGEGSAPWSDCCEKITKVVVESGVTGIGAYAFAGCVNLDRVVLPGTLTDVSENAFSGCTALATVRFCGDEEQWNGIAFESGNSCLMDAKILILGGPMGDVNGDDTVNLGDVQLLFMFTRNKVEIVGTSLTAADVNGDGIVNLGDVQLLFMFTRGKGVLG